MNSEYKRSKVGFPIRKSSDQSLFAAPQGLSQRTTSFIASQRQGIHRMLLSHLIALMIDVRHLAEVTDDQKDLSSDLSEDVCFHDIQSTTLRAAWSVGPKKPNLPNGLLHHRHRERLPSRPKQSGMTPNVAGLGGARRDRTDDLLLAKQALSQLSYGPVKRYARPKLGGPGTTRTSDLTLIRGAL